MSQNVLPESQTSSVAELYKRFGENTSMHGIGRVFASRRPYRRFSWSVMVVFGLGFAIFQFVDLINDFYSYPVTTVVSMKHETKARFPAITICNVNRQRRSLAPVFGKAEEYLEFESVEMEAVINTIMKMIPNGRKSAHQISDMLVKCLINKHVCSEANFSELKTSSYGSCYTFITEDPDLMYTTKAGPQNGLILELDIEHRDYIFLSPTAGLKVIVHEHDQVPFPEDGGIYAHPGVTTSIGIKKTVTRQLPAPYGNCVSAEIARSTRLSLFTGRNYTYTENACRKSCLQLALYRSCECCDEDLPCNAHELSMMAGTALRENQTLSFCSEVDMVCVMTTEIEYIGGGLGCIKSCLPACDQITYENVVSTALWPSDPYLDFVLHKINETVLKNMTFESKTSLKRFIQTNFLRLEIYFDSLDFLEFVTQAKYDWSNLLGDIGGQLGLWLGFSLLTAMEVMELLIDTVLFCLNSCIKRHKAASNNSPEHNL